MLLLDVDERWPRVQLKRGQRRCHRCGEAFDPLPRQRLNLCPYHHRLHELRKLVERNRQYRHRQRALARAYNAVVAPRRSRR